MMRVKLLTMIVVTCLVFSGCGSSSEDTSNQNETHADNETIASDETGNWAETNTKAEAVSETENNTKNETDAKSSVVNINDYSLTGSALEMNGTGTDDSENAYVVYTDGSYEYYFYSDDMTLHMILSTKTDMTASDADTDYLIEQATSYIRQINALDDFTDDDWVVYESTEGLYDLSLTQTVYGETLSVASFTFSGDELLDVMLNTDVLEYEADGTEIIEKETAAGLADEALIATYGDTYTDYTNKEGYNVVTTTLSTHGGNLYWDVQITDGECGGFTAEINAVTGECTLTDQLK